MKRLLVIIVALAGLAVVASAQPKAIGGRIGNYGLDVSYENFVGSDSDFLEFEFGLDDSFSTSAFHFDGVYNFMISRPDWGSGKWGFYAGPGASIAVWENDEDENIVYVGAVGNAGLEYNFDIPLQVSFSLRPRLMFGDGKVRDDGLFTIGIGVRYRF